jgi:hypothetical protein
MSTSAIISAIVGWGIIIGFLWLCIRQIGKGGKWEE